MKWLKTAFVLALLWPLAAEAGVIYGKITFTPKEKKVSRDTLWVVLTPINQFIPVKQLIKIPPSNTFTYKIIVKGIGTYQFRLLKISKVPPKLDPRNDLIMPLQVQIFSRPVEFNLTLKASTSGYDYSVQGKAP